MVQVPSGQHTIWAYVYEDENTFNQDPGAPTDTTYKNFGINETMSSNDRSNNPERMFRPFRRTAEQIIESGYQGSWGADFNLTNTWWLPLIYGSPSTSGSSKPFTHTYDLAPRDPPRTIHLISETHWPNGDISQTVYTGVTAGSASVDVAVNDIVQCSISGAYAFEHNYEDVANSPVGKLSSDPAVKGDQPGTDYRTLHFGNSTFKADLDGNGTQDVQSLVQDASLSLEANAELRQELGTRFAVAPQYLAFEPDVSYTKLTDDSQKFDEQRSAYGATLGANDATPVGTMDGADIAATLKYVSAANKTNELAMNIEGAFPADFSRNNIGDPQAALEDNISRMVTDIQAVVQSDQSEPPGI